MTLPQNELQQFVKTYFSQKERFFDLLLSSPTPLYILDPSVLKKRARLFRQAFEKWFPDCGFYFAMKSNNHPLVSKIMLEGGFGLDVSSGIELATAVELEAQDIIFSGPGKTDAELRLAVSHANQTTVLIDSFSELRRLDGIAAEHGVAMQVGVRLNTNPSGLWRKFGISPDLLPDFLEEARQYPHVGLKGIQFHTSWNLSPRAQTDFIATLGGILAKLPAETLTALDFLDVGGGYWPERGEWLHELPEGGEAMPVGPLVHYRLPAAPIEDFAEQLHRAVDDLPGALFPCRICFEPGRWICNDAMHLITAVIDKKAPDLAIVDAGINAVGWDRFETDYFPVLNLTRPSANEIPCSILGSLCTPHDVFGRACFGADIRVGDILMIPCQGAYTYSLSQRFIKPVPSVAVLPDLPT